MRIDRNRGKRFDLPVGHEVPRGAELLSILEEYRNLPEELPCGLTNCHTGHKKGFVVSFRCIDGTTGEGMIGRRCGEIHFGEGWAIQMRAHQLKAQRAKMEEQAAVAFREIGLVEPLLMEVIAVAEALERGREQLRIAAADLCRDCRDAARSSDGRLRIRTWRGGEHAVHLRGKAFWLRDNLAHKAARLRGDIQVIRKLHDNAATTPPKFADALRTFGSPLQRMREVLADLLDDIEAVQPGEMSLVVDAWNASVNGGYLRIVQGTLRGQIRTIASPEPIWRDIMPLGRMKRLKGQLEATMNQLEDAAEAEAIRQLASAETSTTHVSAAG